MIFLIYCKTKCYKICLPDEKQSKIFYVKCFSDYFGLNILKVMLCLKLLSLKRKYFIHYRKAFLL